MLQHAPNKSPAKPTSPVVFQAHSDELVKTLTRENLQARQLNSQLESQLALKQDYDKQIKQLKQQLDVQASQKAELKSNYDQTSNYLLDVEEKCQEAQTHCLHLLNHLKMRDQEIFTLND